jgi:6-phosphogluconolactonase
MADAAPGSAPDWGRLEVWWGDERYVAGDDEERNAGQAWTDLLARVPVDAQRVHVMPAADDDYLDVEAAAWAHGEELSAAMTSVADGQPWFDVLMLGIGPDGHCASLFPGRGEVDSEAVVLAIRDSPKPPPERITMGMATLRRARHVVFVATGEEKADAVARSAAGGALRETPAAGPRGTESTTWYVDDAAGARL